MTGYTNANGDDRGVLDRYLPTPYRKTGSGTEVHNAFLGAIKNSIISTEQDLVDNVKQVYISNATGKLLDLYGKWIGLSRKTEETDDSYRSRLLDLIVTERVTIKGIIAGIKTDLNDPELDVSIYEPWRNIFILNKSLLNGPDHIMGDFYRYAIIQVTINKYVPQETLNKILKNYKAAGVQVYFVLSNGMSYTGDVLSLPIHLSLQNRMTNQSTKVLSTYNFGINDLPTGTLSKGIFTTNDSDLNGKDVLAGSPENTYAYQYGTVPSKNIFGLVDKTSNPSSFTDPYDYVYQGTKVASPTGSDPNAYRYPYTATDFYKMGRKDNVLESISNASKRLVFALDVKDFMISKGFGDNIGKFNQSAITGFVLSTIGSPYGISNTSFIAHRRTDNAIVSGKWYDYTGNKLGALIGTSIPKGTGSSQKFFYKLDTPADISSIETTDYYSLQGATRSIQAYDGTNYVRLLTTSSQTIGTISIPVITSLNRQLLSASIKAITHDLTDNGYGYLAYNYSKSSWDSITSATNIVDYLQDGAITGGTYILISTVNTGIINIDFAGLNMTCYN